MTKAESRPPRSGHQIDGEPGGAVARSGPNVLEYRHIQIFRQVYQERVFNISGMGLGSTSRNVRRALKDMCAYFGSECFTDMGDGRAEPTPFGERLFNDTRQLDLAMGRLIEKVGAIREQGRVLRIGTSPSIFRTSAFRNIFCRLQKMDGFRISFVQLGPESCSKVLQHGLCDWYIGYDKCDGDRFVTSTLADLPLKDYLRGQINKTSDQANVYRVTQSSSKSGNINQRKPDKTKSIPKDKWIHWLENPAECEEGTIVRCPEMSLDSRFWTEVEGDRENQETMRLYGSFLKQHPYEFLPKLASEFYL